MLHIEDSILKFVRQSQPLLCPWDGPRPILQHLKQMNLRYDQKMASFQSFWKNEGVQSWPGHTAYFDITHKRKKKGILVCFTVSLPEIHPAINSTRGMAFGHRLRMTSTNAQDVAAEHYRRGNSPHVFDISPYHCKMLLCGTQIHNSPLAKVQWWENDLWAKIYKSTLMANV